MTTDSPIKIDRFDGKNLKLVRQRIQELLDEHGFGGIDIRIRRISFTDGDAHITAVARIEGAPTRESMALERAAKRIGLDHERVVDGVRLIGFEPRRRKYPFLAADETGARFKMTENAAKRCFGVDAGEVRAAEQIVRDPAIQPHTEEPGAAPPA